MNIEQVRDFTLSLHGVTEDQPFGDDNITFRVEGKIFLRRMTAGSNTLVRLSTPVFSPYVVLAGAPNTEARNVARP